MNQQNQTKNAARARTGRAKKLSQSSLSTRFALPGTGHRLSRTERRSGHARRAGIAGHPWTLEELLTNAGVGYDAAPVVIKPGPFLAHLEGGPNDQLP